MTNRFESGSRRGVLFALIILAIITAIFVLPFQMRTNAAKGLFQRTDSHEDGLPNYDIRADKTAIDKLANFRTSLGKSASEVADLRDAMVSGEQSLKQRVPTLKIEYNSDIRIPEVIAPDVKQGKAFLTPPSSIKSSDILKDFLYQNAELIGASREQINDLKVAADYTNPDGNLSFVELNQEIHGVPVFRGEIKAGFTRAGEMIRVINNFAPGINYSTLLADFGDPLSAVRAASAYINHELTSNEKNPPTYAGGSDKKVIFGQGDWATTAEKMYFPTEPGVAIPAWRVLIWQPVNAYYLIVDAETSTVLWRKNVTEDQTQSATFNVYANGNAMINVADSPNPVTPGPTSPNGQQGPRIGRTLITRIGNEAPYTFNNNGWITDGGNETDGNANEAGLDRDATNGVDASNGRAVGTSRTFNFAVDPFNPNTNTGDAPIPAGEVVNPCASIVQPHGFIDAQRAAVTQLFYINNWYHDEMYRLGFTEQARNFQASNFGRGGAEADRVSAEAQDCSGTNNANFGTPADGGRGRMQMYLWTAPTPDIDGDFDADVIIHEHTHGLSNRLHGNASGLSTNMSRGMGEGWSDFYGHCMLSEPTDPINGIYTTGAYDTYSPGGVNNSYYAIRRFPKAVMAFTGGTMNRPHNPMTFADIDGTQINLNDGAFPPRFVGTADQVHNAGEVWSSALWEIRARLINRLGWAVGNRKTLQLVTDGMKLAPLGPTFLQERDAIIAAAQASSLAPQANLDVADIWAGFAIRGMGFSAVVTNQGTGTGNARVTEAFDLANLTQNPSFTLSDPAGNNNGFPEPGETVILTLPLFNNSGIDATGVSLQIVGGGSANYGTINNNTAGTQPVTYTVPPATPCGSAITLTFNVNSSLGPTGFTRTLIIGVPVTTYTENFDAVTAPNLPAGWLTAQSGSGVNFATVTNTVNSPPNAVFTPNTALLGGASLTSPAIPITSSAAVVSFRQNYNTESGWDGGTFEISINGGAFTDVLTAGGRFIEGGYNATVGTVAGNPISGRAAWTGDSNGYIPTKIQLPASAAGQNVNLRWLFGEDTNTASVGWWVDTVSVAGTYTCSAPNVKSRADFDGDGKTDVSVFRPSEGNWYLNRSAAGFGVLNWGLAADVLTPGDFDGDGKADTAIFRPDANSANPDFYVLNSNGFTFSGSSWGLAGDIPVVRDYDGDNKADIAVFRPSDNTWYILKSGGGITVTVFGQAGDVPVAGDFDGDGRGDLTVYQNGSWRTQFSGGGSVSIVFGPAEAGDIPVPADYDNDNKDDIAIFRPSNGRWIHVRSSGGGIVVTQWGSSGDIPVPGDYDGDGQDDQAIYRNGQWWLNRSTSGVSVQSFGLSTDIPIPNKYIP